MSIDYAQLKNRFPSVSFSENVLLSELTSFRIGGPCSVVASLDSPSEFLGLTTYAEEAGIPWRLLGNGTNILAPDEGFNGILIRLRSSSEPIRFEGNFVYAEASVSMAALAHKVVHHGLMGMEALSGIPGTVGGACAMNAGAYGTEVADVLRSVTVLRNGSVENLCVDKKDFGYRISPVCAPDTIVFEAKFELCPDDGHTNERMADYQNRRTSKQPLSLPSAGSVFKRPAGFYAGALIEQCGLKGFRIGGACVSEKHAGFIVNDRRATAEDVLNLISLIRLRVFEQTGVMLERELKLLSEV